MSKTSTNPCGSVYHETRKQGDRIRILSKEAKRQAEKARDEYLKNRRDPCQTLMIIGTNMDIHNDPNMYKQVHDEARLIKRPYKEQEIITHDKYDGRALLDDLPEEIPVKYDYHLGYDGEDRELEIMLNYERYRILIEAYRSTANEQKMIEYTEQKINTTLVSHSKFGSQVQRKHSENAQKPQQPKTYTQYGFNYDQPETSEGLVKEIIDKPEKETGKEEKKEEPEIYNLHEKNFLPDTLAEMFARENCNIPWYGILKSFEENQKEYEKTRPKKHIYGGEIIEEKTADGKKNYKERRRLSRQSFRDKIEMKILQRQQNGQEESISSGDEVMKEDEGKAQAEAEAQEKVFIDEFDLGEKEDQEDQEASIDKEVQKKNFSGQKKNSFISFELLREFFPFLNEVKSQYFNQLKDFRGLGPEIENSGGIREQESQKEDKINIKNLLKQQQKQDQSDNVNKDKIQSILQQLSKGQDSSENKEGNKTSNTGQTETLANLEKDEEEKIRSGNTGLFKKRVRFNKKANEPLSPRRPIKPRGSPQYTPPSDKARSRSRSPPKEIKKNIPRSSSSSSSSGSSSGSNRSRSPSSRKKEKRKNRRSSSKDRRRDRDRKRRSRSGSRHHKKRERNKSKKELNKRSKNKRKHKSRSKSSSGSDSSSSSSSSSSGSNRSSRSRSKDSKKRKSK